MNTVVIGYATSSASSPATIFAAAGGIVRLRQWVDFAKATCAAAGHRLSRAVGRRKEALMHRLEEFVLELLAAIVLIAIFMVVTAPDVRSGAST